MNAVKPKQYPALCLCTQKQTIRICYDVKQTNADAQLAAQGYMSMSACDWCDTAITNA